MELSSFTEGSFTSFHHTHASANAEGKDGSKRQFCCVARDFVFCFLLFYCCCFFLFLDLVPEEPTKTVIVCVDLYSLDLDSFLFLTLRHGAITQAMASRH